MLKVHISEEIKAACPDYTVAIITAIIHNTTYDECLWHEIDQLIDEYRKEHTIDSIKEIRAIQATRETYKKCGKDPSRYRPAAEALCRRILKGNELYKVSTVVDLVNAVSMNTGFSIGAFDADKVQGDTIIYGIGKDEEPYEGIGRGKLNIGGLPVWRDTVGGFGTPTSDHERTKLSISTTHLLVTINSYGGPAGLQDAVDYMTLLLTQYAAAKEIRCIVY